jgi:trk system potassium uptake protein TrkA
MVGSFLARHLSEKHSVVIIEKDADRCERLATTTSALVIQGDACDYRYQEESRVDRADVFAAVTGDDDDNLVACQLAKVSFNVPRAVARVNNPKNERIFKLMGIDAISSTTVISHVGDIITLNVLKKGKVVIVEMEIPSAASKASRSKIKDLGLPDGCVLVTIIRDEEVIIPRGEDILHPGDSIIAVTSVDKEEKLKKILKGS